MKLNFAQLNIFVCITEYKIKLVISVISIRFPYWIKRALLLIKVIDVIQQEIFFGMLNKYKIAKQQMVKMWLLLLQLLWGGTVLE